MAQQQYMDFYSPPAVAPDDEEDDTIYCSDCRGVLDEVRAGDDDPLCDECAAGRDAGNALGLLNDGSELATEEALRLIEPHSAWPSNVAEKLVAEAFYYARKGDFDEAKFRLGLAARPKFASVDECKERYAAAMREKREAVA